MEREGSDFLKEKYNLHNTPEVQAAAERTNYRNEQATEEGEDPETIGQDPNSRIENYLHRFTEINDREDREKRQRGIEALKKVLHSNFVIKPEEVPESAFILEQRIARELGYGDVEITDEFRERKTNQIISDQVTSLDKWVKYVSSPDAQYPDWAKYWAMRSVLEMGKLQKQEDENGKVTARFAKREKGKGTTAAFPLLNPRALALTVSVLGQRLDEKSKPKIERQDVPNQSLKLVDPDFQSLLSTENFSKIYAQFLIEMPQYSEAGLQETRGRWVKYDQGSDPHPLVDSLDGYPLEWCTANLDTAQTQLDEGDFFVYYSIDDNNEAKIPRAAIRMQGDSIAEVRGIAGDQNLDPYIAEVVRGKMEEFPDGKVYERKAYDMQMLSYIEKKIQGDQELTKGDLTFLYEIDNPIQGFGYERDPRITELRATRNTDKDILVVFECEPNQIARSVTEINETTKAFVGKLEPGIFTKIAEFNIEHIFTKFPEGKVSLSELEIGGKTKDELVAEIEEKGMKIYDYARDMLNSPDFTTLENPEEISLVRLKVGDLGFTKNPTTDEIYARAAELGLELCPAETGPHQRLKDSEQPLGDYYRIAMKQLTVRHGRPNVFYVYSNDDGLWLNYRWAKPDSKWFLGGQFVFRLRQVSPDTEAPKPFVPQSET